MALDELFKTFEFLKKRIEEHREYLSQDETRTRQVLIDPLLKELGWDVGDPGLVELEYQIEKPFRSKGVAKPDYALMQEGKPTAVVEAKRLDGRMLDDATEQVHTYAYNEVIPYGVATDGDEWRIIDVQKLVRPEEKVTKLFRVSTDDASTCALRSLALWRPNICADEGPVEAEGPVLDVIGRNGPVVCPGIQDANPDDPSDSGWHPVVGDFPKRLPTSVRFGESAPTKWVSWKQLYSDVAEYILSSSGDRLPAPPIKVTKGKKCAINDKPEHPDGTPFRARVELSQGMWLEAFGNRDMRLDYSRRLLTRYHNDPESVQFCFD